LKKIAILCGRAITSQYKAIIYAAGIINAGFHPVIYCKGEFLSVAKIVECQAKFTSDDTNEPIVKDIYEFDCAAKLVQAAIDGGISQAFPCNDWMFNDANFINSKVGAKHYQYDLAAKHNINRLIDGSKYKPLETWHNLEDVPEDLAIFIKPSHGSGTTGGHDWAYKSFVNKEAFINELESRELLPFFKQHQVFHGVLGPYIFQENIRTDVVVYRHYMNDGKAKSWMRGFMLMDINHTCTYMRCTIDEVDDFSFADKLVSPIMGSIQGSTHKGDKVYAFDFNVRSSGVWNYLHLYLCPTFFDTYFNNVLNCKQDVYKWKFNEFEYAFDKEEITIGKDNIVEIWMEDYPCSGQCNKIYLGMV
jgi:hypothetical protein